MKHENFSMFLTDATLLHVFGWKAIKGIILYPSLMHVTCIAHLLHNCAMCVHAQFKNTDEAIATIKAVTIKNKDRK